MPFRTSTELQHLFHPSAADLPDILGIQALCYHSIQPESSASMRAKLTASPRTCFMVRTPSGEALGYLLALPWMANQLPELNATHCHLPEKPDCLYLHDLAIAPQARGRGTASLLISHFLQHLADSTLPVARLIAIQQSAPFWQRHAFRPVEPAGALREKIRSYGDDAQLMERRREPAQHAAAPMEKASQAAIEWTGWNEGNGPLSLPRKENLKSPQEN